MSAWTDLGLPLPNAKGYAYTRDAALLRSPFDSAIPDQDQRNTNFRKTFEVSWDLTLEQLPLAEQYLLQYGYSWFDLELVSNETPTDEIISTHQIRLTSNYIVKPLGGIYFQLNASIESRVTPVSCITMTCDTETNFEEPICDYVPTDPNAFIFTLAMPADDLTFSLGFVTNEQLMSITLDWGDGTVVDVVDWDMEKLSHTYAAAGTYDVSISGECPAPYFQGDYRLIDIKQWGYLEGATNWSYSFENCHNLYEISATDTFGKDVTNMRGMFYGCVNFNSDISSWDVSAVTTMKFMFNDATSFNQDLSCWNVQHIASLPSNFATNCPINGTAKMPKWGQAPNTGCV